VSGHLVTEFFAQMDDREKKSLQDSREISLSRLSLATGDDGEPPSADGGEDNLDAVEPETPAGIALVSRAQDRRESHHRRRPLRSGSSSALQIDQGEGDGDAERQDGDESS